MKNIIELKNVNFKYGNKELFKNLNLQIERGTFTTIIGTNGSGKSTLIRIILGLLVADGEIKINNLELNHKNLKKIISKIRQVFIAIFT